MDKDILYKINLCTFLLFITNICFSQGETECGALIKVLSNSDNLTESESISLEEGEYKSIINHFKENRYETFETAKKFSLSLKIPIIKILPEIGLKSDESGYRTFMSDIDHYFNSYSTYGLKIQIERKKPNKEALEMIRTCYVPGVYGYIFSLDNNSIHIKFRYDKDFEGSKKSARIKFDTKSENIEFLDKRFKKLTIQDKSVADVILIRRGNGAAGIIFSTDTRAKYGLGFSFPEVTDNVKTERGKITKEYIIQPHEFTFVPPKIGGGDADFDGNCDIRSTADLRISEDGMKVILKLWMDASEPESDWTRASGYGEKVIFEVQEKNHRITKINTSTHDRGDFKSRNDIHGDMIFEPYLVYCNSDIDAAIEHARRNKSMLSSTLIKMYEELKVRFKYDFTNNGLVKKWLFVGDTKGAEAGTRTKVTVFTNPVSILISEN